MIQIGKALPDNLILALDVNEPEVALKWVRRMKGRMGIFKIGLQLFTREGPDIVRRVRDEGVDVFLDLKLHDIPNTVAKAVTSCGTLGARFLTVHAMGGSDMLRAAADASVSSMTILGVTVLTSHSQEDLKELGFNHSITGEVSLLARLGKESGLRGFVCSPHEIAHLRSELGEGITLVTPGVRPAGGSQDDQSRVMTPQEALSLGSSHVVLGRPILRAENPEAVVDEILSGK